MRRRNVQKAAPPADPRRSPVAESLPPKNDMPGGLPSERYVNAYWDGNKVVLVSRNAGTVRTRTVPAEYAVFLRHEDVTEEHLRKMRNSHHTRTVKSEGDWWRVVFHDYWQRKKNVEPGGFFDSAGIPTFEGDLNPVRRYLTDHNVEIQKPRRCYLDLETDSREVDGVNAIARAVKGNARILTWAVADDEGAKISGVLGENPGTGEFETDSFNDEHERELLMDLWYVLQDYDQICAWNGKFFDFPVLKKRTEKVGIKVAFSRWMMVDQMEIFESKNKAAAESGDEKTSMGLDAIGTALLGRGKTDFDSSMAYDFWAGGDKMRGELASYNVDDAILQRDIEAKCGFLDDMFIVCEICHTFPDERGNNPTNYFEGYVLREGLASNEHFKTRHHMEKVEQYKGAKVVPPTMTGIIDNVRVCDFARLYPAVMISFNMCPTTISDMEPVPKRTRYLKQAEVEYEIPEGYCLAPITNKLFRTKVPGIFPRVLDELQKERDKWKKIKAAAEPKSKEWVDADRRQAALKICINSGYGVLGSIWSRFYIKDLAESVTQVAMWLLNATLDEAKSFGYKVLYGDTDSSFISDSTHEQFIAFVKRCNEELYPRLLKAQGAPNNVIDLAYEKAFSKVIFTDKKKRYAGRISWYEGTTATKVAIEIKGLEYKRGDSVRLGRAMQYQFILAILKHDITDTDEIEAFVRVWRWRILHADMEIGDFLIIKRLSKGSPDSYVQKLKKDGTPAALPPHVRIAKMLIERGQDIRQGARIEYVVTDASTKPATIIPMCDYDNNLDRFHLWEEKVYGPTLSLLEFAFPSIEWKKKYRKVRPSKPRKKKAGAKAATKRKPKMNLAPFMTAWNG